MTSHSVSTSYPSVSSLFHAHELPLLFFLKKVNKGRCNLSYHLDDVKICDKQHCNSPDLLLLFIFFMTLHKIHSLLTADSLSLNRYWAFICVNAWKKRISEWKIDLIILLSKLRLPSCGWARIWFYADSCDFREWQFRMLRVPLQNNNCDSLLKHTCKSSLSVLQNKEVIFLVWPAALDQILTIDNLICHRHILVNWCCMCRGSVESVSHLLIYCSVAYQLWGLIFAVFGLEWVQPRDVVGVLWSWRGARVGKHHWKACDLAPLCLMWSIWLERNRQIFQGWMSRCLVRNKACWAFCIV